MVGGVGLQCHWEIWKPVAKYRHRGKSFLQLAEGHRLHFAKNPGCCFSAKICEGVGDVRIVINESAVEIGESQEGLDIMDIAGYGPSLNG